MDFFSLFDDQLIWPRCDLHSYTGSLTTLRPLCSQLDIDVVLTTCSEAAIAASGRTSPYPFLQPTFRTQEPTTNKRHQTLSNITLFVNVFGLFR
jgi:hypothetical protein